ncbi:MAG: DUF2249 domain-containing protein [Bacteroidota bacterium]|nr:DUF2249 domain-containing protein [Bacteroidota bacterium]
MKISALLSQYPEALNALLEASPAFQKLRNPLLRKLMASRVSIEQAAHIGGIPVKTLLTLIEEACGVDSMVQGSALASEQLDRSSNHALIDRPPILRDTNEQNIIRLDVRDDILENRDPFRTIMKAVKALQSNQVLHLINSFEPIPLYELLAGRDFDHWSEQIDDAWNVYFFKSSRADRTSGDSREDLQNPPAVINSQTSVIELDVSGLEPPEPMRRILITLGTLPTDSSLAVQHHREPFLLYEQLQERGYVWSTIRLADDLFRITITRGTN